MKAEWKDLAESKSLSVFNTIQRATAFPEVYAELVTLRNGQADAAAKALEDAAEDVDLSEFYDPDPRGQVSQECGHAETVAHRWLTERAASLRLSTTGDDTP